MKFETTDLIYYIGVIAFFLYSFFKKKPQQKTKTASPAEQIPDFKSIFRTEQPAQKKQTQYKAEKVKHEQSKQNTAEKPSIKTTRNTTLHSSEESTESNFDLRQAMIHSVILNKPPYQE